MQRQLLNSPREAVIYFITHNVIVDNPDKATFYSFDITTFDLLKINNISLSDFYKELKNIMEEAGLEDPNSKVDTVRSFKLTPERSPVLSQSFFYTQKIESTDSRIRWAMTAQRKPETQEIVSLHIQFTLMSLEVLRGYIFNSGENQHLYPLYN